MSSEEGEKKNTAAEGGAVDPKMPDHKTTLLFPFKKLINTPHEKGDGSKPTEDDPDSAGSPFSTDSLRKNIYEGCKLTVNATNSVLAGLQSTSNTIRKPVTAGLTSVEQEGTKALTSCRVVYDRRQEFGPYWVVGSTLGVGGITAMRRGRLPGLVLGGLAGGAAYYFTMYEPSAKKDDDDDGVW